MYFHPILLSRRSLCAAAVGACCVPPVAARPVPALLLAREWPADADPAGYLVSEKLDGVRALWDGHGLRFRSGAPIAAPRAFTDRLPAQPLDGELWLGRGRFDELSGRVRRAQADAAFWREVQFQVFELPAAGGRFADRAQALQRLCQGHQALHAVPQAAVANRADLRHRLEAVVASGGEGLMLHHADAPQATGRGRWLWKHKPQHDAEGLVLDHLPGQGRLAGRVGALQVRTESGVVFHIGAGLGDAERNHPPPVGQRITYRHSGFTPAGVPRFASFLRMASPV